MALDLVGPWVESSKLHPFPNTFRWSGFISHLLKNHPTQTGLHSHSDSVDLLALVQVKPKHNCDPSLPPLTTVRCCHVRWQSNLQRGISVPQKYVFSEVCKYTVYIRSINSTNNNFWMNEIQGSTYSINRKHMSFWISQMGDSTGNLETPWLPTTYGDIHPSTNLPSVGVQHGHLSARQSDRSHDMLSVDTWWQCGALSKKNKK